jgi:hypothetical protein
LNIDLYLPNGAPTLTPELGLSAWNLAVQYAPYRTGNLRRNILLQNNGPKVKRIIYNDTEAFYLNYLENGIGPIKKHKGFIEDRTVGGIFSETIFFLNTGQVTFPFAPSVTLRTDRARNYERTILRNNNISMDKRLTANDRALLSREFSRQNGFTNAMKGVYTKNLQTPTVLNNQNDKLYFGYGKMRSR